MVVSGCQPLPPQRQVALDRRRKPTLSARDHLKGHCIQPISALKRSVAQPDGSGRSCPEPDLPELFGYSR
jgi:hypothetical protein